MNTLKTKLIDKHFKFLLTIQYERVLLMLTTVPVRFTTTLAGLAIDLMLQGTKLLKEQL